MAKVDLSFLPDQETVDLSFLPDKEEKVDLSFLPDKQETPDLSFLPDKDPSGPDLSFLPDKETLIDAAKKVPFIGPAVNLLQQKPKGITEKQEVLLDTVIPPASLDPIMGTLMKTETGKRLAANFAQGTVGSAGSMAAAIPAAEAFLDVDTKVGKSAQVVADELNAIAKEIAPEDPNFVDHLASGAGSMALFMIPGAGTQAMVMNLPRFGALAAKMAPALGASASAILESATEAGGVYDDQVKKGINRETASKAAFQDFWSNAILVGLTNRFGVFGDKFNGLKKALVSAPLEGLQEAGQSILASVSKDEPINWEEVATSAGVGAIIGGGVGAAMPGAETKEEVKETVIDEKTVGKEGMAYLGNRFPALSQAITGQTLPVDAKQAHETIKKAAAAGEEVLLRGGNPLEAERAALAEFKRSIDAIKPPDPPQPVVPSTPTPQETSAVKVAENVSGQLQKAGYDPETAGTYSKIYEKAFKTLGERAGVDPLELFNKYGLQIQKKEGTEEPTGQAFEQGKVIKMDVPGGLSTRVIQNPTAEQAATVFNNSQDGAARYFVDPKGNLYVWDAFDLAHADVMKNLGVKLTSNNYGGAGMFRSEEQAVGLAKRIQEEKSFNQPAFHGSPHKFEKFSLQKIGTGEGAQAYGYGLYFAGKKEVAEFYKNTLGQPAYQGSIPYSYAQDAQGEAKARGLKGQEAKRFAIQFLTERAASRPPESRQPYYDAANNFDELTSGKRGHLYKVEIPEDNEYLDWDKPLSQQSEKVKAALLKEGLFRNDPENVTYAKSGQELYASIRFARGSEKAASNYLASLGIPGIKYKDQGSRLGSYVRNSKDNTKFEVADDKTGKTIQTFDTLEEANTFKETQGTSNYVIFDDKLVKIMEYEQRRGKEDPRGRIRFGQERQFNIDLLKDADLSTFIHESGHFYLEVLKDLASDPKASADIKTDFDILLKWFNVKSAEEIGVDQHEQFARGFEAYLMEGKAPTPELKSVFERFKEWLVAIYKEMGNLRVDLTPEVRDVFDRILAGRDEIGATKAKIKETFQQKDLSPLVYEENRAQVMKGTGILQTIKTDIANIRADIGKAADKFLGLISTRLKNIDPSLKMALRNFEYKVATNTLQDMRVAESFMKKKAQMSERDRIDYDLAQKNGDEQVMNYLNMRYGMVGEASLIRDTLNRLHGRAREVGFDIGYRQNYFPRAIKDPVGFLDYFHRSEDWSIIEEAIKRKEADLNRYLDDAEKATLINNMIRGYSGGQITLSETGAMKNRKIDFVDADLNRFYYDSDAALVRYVNSTNNAIEARRFFGKGNKELNYNNIEDSIGAYTLDLVAKKKISPSHEKELRDILSARFSPRSPGSLTSLYKNLSYIDTMGSITSAITQLGDLAFALTKSGPIRTAIAYGKALAGKSEIKPADIGIDRIAEEFSDAKKSAATVGRIFKLVGLHKMDALGKETVINSTIAKFRDQAKQANPPNAFIEKLTAVFGDETSEIVDDLRNDRLTENVKLLAFNELLDVQPVALSEMPEKYLSGGNGRIFYMLKTYQLKLFDIYRNEIFQKMQQPGIENKIEATRRLIYLSAALMLMNATADEIKDLLLNRKMTLSDRIGDNIARLFGFSKFTIYEAKNQGIGSALARTILPPMKLIDSLYKDFIKYNPDKFTLEGNFWKNKKMETPASIPLVGKFYYWWLGKGAEKEKKRRKRAKKKTSLPRLP